MIRIVSLFMASLLAALSAPQGVRAQPTLLAHWVQIAPGSQAEGRAVVSGNSCPPVVMDGKEAPMRKRAAADANFPNLLCAVTLPKNAKTVSILGVELPLPKTEPQRIAVLGDTGCRIKGFAVQACNDPLQWRFPQIATQIAKLKPDLIVHVGDYLYRESPCPALNAACAGSPSGDNWATWAADFFTPAAPMLAAAPIALVRGNHEECARAGAGWLRLLGPLPYDPHVPCTDHVAPYAVPLGHLTLVMMDDAHASDTDAPDDLVRMYRADFAAVGRLAPSPVWLAMHRPIWGVVQLAFGIVLGGNRTLMAAQDEGGMPANVALLLAGHIHTFEAINYEKGLPPQIIAGEGGTLFDKAPANLAGRSVGAAKIANGISLPGYGFLLLTRNDDRWAIDVLDADGRRARNCVFAAHKVDCLGL
jgi:hypothetical protein